MLQKTKILVTGSNGFLGQNLVNLLVKQADLEVFAFSRGSNKNLEATNFEYASVNITNADFLETKIRKIKPNFIINCAAMTNVDACELRINECKAINVNAIRNLVSCCKLYKAHLIHISTDFIFDGIKGNYIETDTPNPLNYYGKSKLEAEKILQRSNIDFTILRTILVFGKVQDVSKSNIVLWVINELENKRKINVINDQFRTPTLVNDLAMACLLAIQKNKIKIEDKQIKDVYHISSNTLLSIYEIALQIAEIFNLDKKLINKITTKDLNQKAKRPPKTGFTLDKAVNELGFKSVSFKESLKKFKKTLHK